MPHPCLCDICLKARDAEIGRVREAQDDAIMYAFLGIGVLRTMCRKAGLTLAEKRAAGLLVEMDTAFPGLAARSALRANSHRHTRDSG